MAPYSRSGPSRGDSRGPRRSDDRRSPGAKPRGERPGPGATGPRSRDERARGGPAGPRSRDERVRGGASRSRTRVERSPGGLSGERRRVGTSDRGPTPGPRRAPGRLPDPKAVLARQPWSALRLLIPGNDAEIEARIAALKDYATRLLEWNRGVSNLVSRHDEPRLVDRHLRESLVPAKLIEASGCRTFVDFGSGAGLPAVPLGLCGIGAKWMLVESRRNKTLFLRKLQQDIGLKQFEVHTGRLEVLVTEDPSALACDGFTSRATAAIGPTLELAAGIVAAGGRAFLWKGSSYEQEMADGGDEWKPAWRLERVVEIGDGPNVVAVFERLAAE